MSGKTEDELGYDELYWIQDLVPDNIYLETFSRISLNDYIYIYICICIFINKYIYMERDIEL